jgi:mono/diheme cytochrome c family protein
MILVVVFAAAAGPLAACGRAANASADPDDSRRVDRGRYLVETIGCHDCHTPKKMGPNGPELDTTRLLSGHPEQDVLPPPPASSGPWAVTATWDLTAWSGPWGITYPANLTPDQNTGTGIWDEQMFTRAIRTGRHMGVSRQILPPMPWEVYRNLTDADLAAIFAYLRSIPPVTNHVPDPVPPAAAN